MSLTVTPNYNDYIDRIALILSKSTLLFPNSVGGDETQQDLVKQIIAHELPQNETPITGGGPPHIFVKESRNPIYERKQVGRDSIDAQGPESFTLEFYIVVVAFATTTFADSQISANNIVQAVTTTLDKNKRLLDDTGNNPIAKSSQWVTVPWLLENNEQRELLAVNVIFRPEVYVNLR